MRLPEAFGVVAILLVVWSLYRAHRSKALSDFNLFDLLMENGRASKLACAFWLAFGFYTWVLWRITIDGKMSEGYIAAYGLTWVAPIIAKMFAGPPAAPPA